MVWLRGFLAHAIRQGVARPHQNMRRWVVDRSFGCTRPVVFLYTGKLRQKGYKGNRAPAAGGARAAGQPAGPSPKNGLPKPLFVDAYQRCRKCDHCMVMRSRQWAARALNEFDRAERSYMGTFTLTPDDHAQMDVKVAGRGLWPDRSRLSEEAFQKALFHARCQLFGQEITKWLKRVRKASGGARIRYLLVAEAHDSVKTDPWMRKRPHFHVIIHEAVGGALIKGSPLEALANGNDGELRRVHEHVFVTDEAMIRQEWRLGFTKFEYCFNGKSAYYLCKYLSKSMMHRVRASLKYGEAEKDPERSDGVLFPDGEEAERLTPQSSDEDSSSTLTKVD